MFSILDMQWRHVERENGNPSWYEDGFNGTGFLISYQKDLLRNFTSLISLLNINLDLSNPMI